jgi:hypothetical protein
MIHGDLCSHALQSSPSSSDAGAMSSQWMPGGGDDRPEWATPTKHGHDGTRRPKSNLPGSDEVPIEITLNVRKVEKFFEIKHA